MSGIAKAFGTNQVLRDVSITLKEGEVHALMGENGAGKSTLMNILTGIHKADAGKITIDGVERTFPNPREAELNGVAFIHQELNIWPNLTLLENLYLMRPKRNKFGMLDKKAMLEEAQNTCRELGIELPLTTEAGLCSVGHQQMTEILRILMLDAKVVIMDEPTAGLDPGERVRLRNFISEFSHDRIVLISTHIVSDIEYISTRNAIMKAGEIVDVGTTAELVKRIEGKVWNCIIPTSKLPECEMRLRIINQRGEDHNQVSIRYLSEHSEIDGSVTTEQRLEDLYLWLFPQTDLEKEDR